MIFLDYNNNIKTEKALFEILLYLTNNYYKLLLEKDDSEDLTDKISHVLDERQNVIDKIKLNSIAKKKLVTDYSIPKDKSQLKIFLGNELYNEFLIIESEIQQLIAEINDINEKANILMQKNFDDIKSKLTNVRQNKVAIKAYNYENANTDGWFIDQKK